MKKPDSLKIGYYNTVYCTEAQSLSGWARTHWHHIRGKHQELPPIADTERAMEFVNSEDFDLIVLSEILGEKQRSELQAKLSQRSYSHTQVGHGHGLTGLPGQDVEMLLASKHRLEAIELPQIETPAAMGHGGGLIYSHLPDFNCDVVAAHLALPKNAKSFEAQVTALVETMAKRIGKECERVILIGDFNVTPEQLQAISPELIEGLELLSPNVPTCNTVKFLSLFYSKCIDHIWGRGFRVLNSNTYLGQSDHKGIIVELEAV
ncbi:endonuclease/exonuclease/phosphatase family protein [Candidatus Gracilibacteria bacterium]|nr:endonuclease/exonuclease/phosphatase family protein [Candidatus Gracilibacteria bacterium]